MPFWSVREAIQSGRQDVLSYHGDVGLRLRGNRLNCTRLPESAQIPMGVVQLDEELGVDFEHKGARIDKQNLTQTPKPSAALLSTLHIGASNQRSRSALGSPSRT